MTPDEAKALKPGDRILVEMVVVDRPGHGKSPDAVAAHPTVAGEDYWTRVDPGDIREVLARPFQIGDRVMWDGDEYEVAAPARDDEIVLVGGEHWRGYLVVSPKGVSLVGGKA